MATQVVPRCPDAARHGGKSTKKGLRRLNVSHLMAVNKTSTGHKIGQWLVKKAIGLSGEHQQTKLGKEDEKNEAEVWKRGFVLALATSPLGLYKSHLNGKLNQMEEGPSSDMRHTQPMRKKILLFDVILKFNSRKCIITITRTLQWLSSLRFLSPRMTARKSGSYLKSNQPSLKLNVCVFHRCTLSSKLKVHWEESVLKICEGLKGTLSLHIYVYLSSLPPCHP